MCQTQKFTIRENSNFNSLEISFTGIPDSETRSKLKALGFRWNPKKSVWYGYADRENLENDLKNVTTENVAGKPGVLTEAQTENITEKITVRNYPFKTFTVLSPDEAYNIINDHIGSSWDKYYKEQSKQNTYSKFNDGYIVKFKRPGISNCMYYDDELESPDTDYDSFESYNLHYNNCYLYFESYFEARENLEKYGCCIGGYERMYLTNCTNSEVANISVYDDHSYKLGFKRYLTDDEAQEVKKLVELLKADYIKRLKTYYKRYGDKITTHGYWANR